MRNFSAHRYKILLLLFLLDILILILTALSRTQYILYHFAEIVFLGIFISIITGFLRNYRKKEEKQILVFNSALFAYSIIWLSGVIILERVQVELTRDFFYALLLIIFVLTIIIFIISSLLELYSNRMIIKPSFNIVLVTWVTTAISFLLITILLAPQEDITELIMKISNIL
jgi:hypothetical protein